jgi:hypothetical protein
MQWPQNGGSVAKIEKPEGHRKATQDDGVHPTNGWQTGEEQAAEHDESAQHGPDELHLDYNPHPLPCRLVRCQPRTGGEAQDSCADQPVRHWLFDGPTDQVPPRLRDQQVDDAEDDAYEVDEERDLKPR